VRLLSFLPFRAHQPRPSNVSGSSLHDIESNKGELPIIATLKLKLTLFSFEPPQRRQVVSLLLLSFPLVFYTLFTYRDSSSFDPFRSFILSSSTSRYSAIENYLEGSWRPLSTPITNLSSLEHAYPGYFFHDGTCGGGLERLYKIASWEWVGADGKGTPWDGRRFAVDVLKRQGGILLVGGELALSLPSLPSFPSFAASSLRSCGSGIR